MKATRADSADDELSMLIHDLRNPLSAIVSALRIIEHHATDHPELQDAVDLGLRGSDEMVELITRLHKAMKELLERNG